MMMDDDPVLGMNRRSQMAANVGFLMLKGAGYAAIVVFVLWASIALLAAFRFALPPESQEARDPSPWTPAYEAPAVSGAGSGGMAMDEDAATTAAP